MPKDIRSHYNTRRISFSLKTKSKVEAYNSSLLISKNLENYWFSIRLKSDHLQIDRFISEKSQIPLSISPDQDEVKFSNAVNIYIKQLDNLIIKMNRSQNLCANLSHIHSSKRGSIMLISVFIP